MPFNESLLRHGPAPRVIAHRGAAAHRPENTMSSFHAAFEAGALWVETDVQPTADDRLVLIHDHRVDRTSNGTGLVRNATADDLAALDMGSWFGAEWAGQKLPHLTELLTLITGPRRLLLEIKGSFRTAQLRLLLAALDAAGVTDRVFLQSFDVPTLRRLRKLLPHDPIGLLVETIDGDPVAACRALAAATFNPDYRELIARPELVGRLHDAGIATMPWTANDESAWQQLTDLGVDGIITDRPGELLAWQGR